MTENEMVGGHHQLSGHEFEQTAGDSEGQGCLACCSSWSGRVGHNIATEQKQQIIYQVGVMGYPSLWWPELEAQRCILGTSKREEVGTKETQQPFLDCITATEMLQGCLSTLNRK